MDDKEKRGELAHRLHKKIASNEETRRMLFATNGYLLAEMHDDKLYKDHLGDEDAPWSGYLAEVEVYYTRNQVRNFLRIHKKFVKGLGLDWTTFVAVPVNRLLDLIPVVEDEDVKEWFFKAMTLTPKDWRIEIRQAKGLLTEEDEHECKKIDFEICSECGKKERKK